MRTRITSPRSPVLAAVGAVLIGLGFLVVSIRRDTPDVFGDSWGSGAIFATFALPCLLLLATGLLSPRDGDAAPWQTVSVVFGLLFLPLALAQLVDWVAEPDDVGNSLNIAWIFGLTAAVGLYSGLGARVRYALFLAAVSLVIAWLALWGQILSGGIGDHTTTLRWLLVLAAAGLVGLGALAQARASEFVTAAVLAAVAAGAVSGFAIYGDNPFITLPHANASFFWSLELLLVAIAAIVYGAGAVARGPVYAGALGLFAFALIVGLDLAHTDSPDGTLLGWPIVLVVLGVGAYVASFAPARR